MRSTCPRRMRNTCGAAWRASSPPRAGQTVRTLAPDGARKVIGSQMPTPRQCGRGRTITACRSRAAATFPTTCSLSTPAPSRHPQPNQPQPNRPWQNQQSPWRTSLWGSSQWGTSRSAVDVAAADRAAAHRPCSTRASCIQRQAGRGPPPARYAAPFEASLRPGSRWTAAGCRPRRRPASARWAGCTSSDRRPRAARGRQRVSSAAPGRWRAGGRGTAFCSGGGSRRRRGLVGRWPAPAGGGMQWSWCGRGGRRGTFPGRAGVLAEQPVGG